MSIDFSNVNEWVITNLSSGVSVIKVQSSDGVIWELSVSNIAKVVCTYGVTWFIDKDDNLYGCGHNNYGQQGSGNTTDVTTFTQRASNVKEVVCTDYSTWYITNDV